MGKSKQQSGLVIACRNFLFISFLLITLPLSAIAADSGDMSTHKKSLEKTLEIVVTTYPIYLLTKNITEGAIDVNVDIVVNSAIGCPYDYFLTTQDVMKIKAADLFIINGLGMDNNMADIIKDNTKIVDTSSAIEELIQQDEDDENAHHKHDHDSHNSSVNPHLFASPARYAKLIDPILNKLLEFDKSNSDVYQKNAIAYKTRLMKLAGDFSRLIKQFNSPKVVTQFTAFDYLAKDTGISIIAIIQEHPGEAPSASRTIKIIKQIKESGVKAIIAEPQFDDRYAKMISEQTKIPIIQMDPVASGPENICLRYYELMMYKNMENLNAILRVSKN